MFWSYWMDCYGIFYYIILYYIILYVSWMIFIMTQRPRAIWDCHLFGLRPDRSQWRLGMGHANLQWVLLLRTNITSTNHRRGDFCEIQDWQVAVNLETSTGQVKTRPRGCCQWQQLPSRTDGAREIHLQRRGRRPHYRLGCLAPTQPSCGGSIPLLHPWIIMDPAILGMVWVIICQHMSTYVNICQQESSHIKPKPQPSPTKMDHCGPFFVSWHCAT